MPLYEFVCNTCKKEDELLLKFDEPPPACKNCSGDLVKKISVSAFHLKGGGWYKDGYSKQNVK